MNILFVSSGNHKYGISPIVKAQAESLRKIGLNVQHFLIKGKGYKNYFKSIKLLKNYKDISNVDVCHAHYSLSGYVAALAGINKPILVSLMGSDVVMKFHTKSLINLFSKYKWDGVLTKSDFLSKKISVQNINVIPNGVDFSLFKPIDKLEAMNKVGWDVNKKHVLFPADKNRFEKNFNLAENAFNKLKLSNIKLHSLKNVPYELIPFYLNAADVVLLTSLWEGSPNVIKESMACNRPIVSTEVGDVENVIQGTKGCYISSFDVNDVVEKIHLALTFEYTSGRSKIYHLKEEVVANKLLNVYSKIKYENNKKHYKC